MGDEAVLAGILRALRAAEPAVRVTVLSDDPPSTAAQFDVRAIARRPGYKRRLAGEALALLRCDAFLLGGGGLIKDYGAGPGNVHVWVRPLLVAAALRKPSMTYAIGVDGIRFDESRAIARDALRRTTLVTARDEGTVRAMGDLGYDGPVATTADPALLLGTPRPQAPPGPPRVAVSVRHWFANDARVDEPDRIERHDRELARALDTLVDEHGVRIVFVPFREHAVDDDALACRRIAEQMRRGDAVEHVAMPATPEAAVELLAGCSLVIGTRLHSLILAASTATPFVGFDYMPKMGFFAERLGVTDRCFTLDQTERDGFLREALTAAWRDRDALRAHLAATVPALQDVAWRNGQAAVALARRDGTARARAVLSPAA
ncbi:MAG TPA: polysaccharide pyruvyl transferase family protein [Baekduia sp.]|nr:polysaccharide pyruvyl transferase family protein [Baekduia sp.]